MGNIRITNLPYDPTPSQSDVMIVDGLVTRKTTIVEMVNAARPFASQAEAEAGVSTTVGMNPLATEQAITAIGGTLFASTAQGTLADTAVQPSRQVASGTGLTGGGDLSTDRTIDLDAASVASLALADTSVQPSRQITAGTGISGGGDLSADRSISLDSGSQASLVLANWAVQPSRQVATGTGLTGGGDLSTNRTVALNGASVASLALADTAVQPARQISAGTGLAGGGNLSADRTLSLSGATQVSLALADTAVQQAQLDAVAVPPGGTTGQVLAKTSNTDNDVEWTAAGAGDLLAVNNLSDVDSVPSALTNLGIPQTAETYLRRDAGNTAFEAVTRAHVLEGLQVRNYCWNGNFDIWQRGTSFTAIAARIGTADGWTFARSSTALGATVSQQAGSRGNNLAMRVQRDSGNTGIEPLTVVFNMSMADSRPLIDQDVVLTFRARCGADFSSASNQLTAQIKSSTSITEQAITAANGTYTTGDTTEGGVGPTLTTTLQTFTLADTMSATAKQFALRFTYAPAGTAGANDWFEIEEVQLEIGTSATSFVQVDPAIALEKARKQYRKTYNDSVTPGTVTYSGALRTTAVGTVVGEAVQIGVQMDPPMRAAPTVVLYSPQTGAVGELAQAATADITGTVVHIGIEGFGIQNVDAATASKPYYVHYTAEAKL